MNAVFLFILSLFISGVNASGLSYEDRTVSEVVEESLLNQSDPLVNFDPLQDIILFDFDETIVEKNQKGQPRKLRSSGGILKIFINIRDTYPGSAFIYSNGNSFVYDHIDIGLDSLKGDSPDDLSKEEKDFLSTLGDLKNFNINFGSVLKNIPAVELEKGVLFFPQFEGFFISGKALGVKTLEHMDQLKGNHLFKVLDFIIKYTQRHHPIRNVYLVDDRFENMSQMTLAGDNLNKNGVILGKFIPIHVPY